jgi:hypothetical protein
VAVRSVRKVRNIRSSPLPGFEHRSDLGSMDPEPTRPALRPRGRKPEGLEGSGRDELLHETGTDAESFGDLRAGERRTVGVHAFASARRLVGVTRACPRCGRPATEDLRRDRVRCPSHGRLDSWVVVDEDGRLIAAGRGSRCNVCAASWLSPDLVLAFHMPAAAA